MYKVLICTSQFLGFHGVSLKYCTLFVSFWCLRKKVLSPCFTTPSRSHNHDHQTSFGLETDDSLEIFCSNYSSLHVVRFYLTAWLVWVLEKYLPHFYPLLFPLKLLNPSYELVLNIVVDTAIGRIRMSYNFIFKRTKTEQKPFLHNRKAGYHIANFSW